MSSRSLHSPFKRPRLFRSAALLLAAVLSLPNSAFSLRDSIEDGTPARLAQELRGVLPSKLTTAGLEEIALLPPLKAHRQIEGFLKGMQQGMRQNGGYQSAGVVDLRGLVDKKVIFVGDMHGYGGILERVLKREDMEDEKTVLILMGDAVHREEEQDWLEMDSSIRQVQKAMELKIRYPRRVYYLLGNHDRPTLTVKRSLRKGGRPYEIGKAYFEKLQEHYGPEYVEKYKRFLAQSPLLVIGDGWAAVHAGPIAGATVDQIREANVASILAPLKAMDPIVDQAVNGTDYHINSTAEFLRNLGLPRGSRLVTSHYHLRTTWWHRKLLAFTQDPDWVDVVHNIYAGERSRFGRWGYARYQNGALELVKFFDEEPEEGGIDRYAVPQDRLHPPPAGGLEEISETVPWHRLGGTIASYVEFAMDYNEGVNEVAVQLRGPTGNYELTFIDHEAVRTDWPGKIAEKLESLGVREAQSESWKMTVGNFDENSLSRRFIPIRLSPSVPDATLAGGLEERDRVAEQPSTLIMAGEILDGYRSGIQEPKFVVIGKSLGDRLGLQVLAGLEEHVVIQQGKPDDLAIALAEKGVTHVQYFGGLEEAFHFTEVADPLGIKVTAHPLEDPTSVFLLKELLEGIGVPKAFLASGLEELDRNLTELGRAA